MLERKDSNIDGDVWGVAVADDKLIVANDDERGDEKVLFYQINK